MYKLGYQKDHVWVQHIHPRSYTIQYPETTSVRLRAGLPHGDVSVFEALGLTLKAPYYVLYILHTPRGEGEAGRYLSPLLNAVEFCNFLHTFSAYLTGDGRFDLWVHSPESKATIAWDRHNQIFAYGPLDRYTEVLSNLEYEPGAISIDFPHEHYYRPENDEMANKLLQAFDWHWSPLRPEDEQ